MQLLLVIDTICLLCVCLYCAPMKSDDCPLDLNMKNKDQHKEFSAKHKRGLHFSNGVQKRKRRYDYADYYDWDNDKELLDYDENKNSDSPLEWLERHGKKVVVSGLIALSVGLCVCCTCCVCCAACCKEVWRATKKNCCQCCDRIRRRDANYRVYADGMERLGLDPPTYKQYEEMKLSLGGGKRDNRFVSMNG